MYRNFEGLEWGRRGRCFTADASIDGGRRVLEKSTNFAMGVHLAATELEAVPQPASARVLFAVAWRGNVGAGGIAPDIRDDAASHQAGGVTTRDRALVWARVMGCLYR